MAEGSTTFPTDSDGSAAAGTYDGTNFYHFRQDNATAKNLKVALYDIAGNPLLVVDDAAFTPGTSPVVPVGFVLDDVAPDTVNEGDAGAARMSASRVIRTVPGKDDGTPVQFDDTDKMAVSLYGKNLAAGDTAVEVDANNGATKVELYAGNSNNIIAHNDANTAPNTGLKALVTQAVGVDYNGSAFEIRRTAVGATDTAGTGLAGAGLLAWDVTNSVFRRLVAASRDAESAHHVFGAVPMLYNGSSTDRARGNLEGTLLASAARTGDATSADQTSYNARGVIVWLNISVASGTGGLVMRIRGKDPVSGNYYNLHAFPPAKIAATRHAYMLYPGASATGAVSDGYVELYIPAVLPRTWGIYVAHGDGSSYTYSVGYSLIV